MSHTGYKIGELVQHCEFRTVGKVIDINEDGAVYVYWENGTTGYYGPNAFHHPLSLLRKI